LLNNVKTSEGKSED